MTNRALQARPHIFRMLRSCTVQAAPSTSVGFARPRPTDACQRLAARRAGCVPGPRSSRRRTAHRSLQCVASVSVDTESLSTDNFWWKLGPEPVKFPRPALKRAFAVLLMRSTYESLDELDFCPTDEFQVSFWKLRAAEQEAYMLQYEPLKFRQGDLTDPLYFDFISFSQYLAVNKEIRQGKQVFEEKIGAEGEVRTVRRDQAISDNAVLPAAMATLIGDKVYTGLVEGFQEEVFGAPGPCPAGPLDADCVLQGVRGVAEAMQRAGFCIKAEVARLTEEGGGSGELRFTVRAVGPATLWGMTVLSGRRVALMNDYLGFALKALVRRSGRTGQFKTSITDIGIEQSWVVR